MKLSLILKKYLMLLIKLVVGLFPKKFRSWFKKFPVLTSLYSRSLQKSGLFYGFPSRKKLDALYAKNRLQQNKLIAGYKSIQRCKLNLVVVVPKNRQNQLIVTIKSLVNIVDTDLSVFILCDERNFTECQSIVSKYASSFSEVKFQSTLSSFSIDSAFFIYSGDALHPLISFVIFNYFELRDAILYVDTDFFEKQKHTQPRLLPDWNPALQLSTAYVNTGVWIPEVSLFVDAGFSLDAESIAIQFAKFAIMNKKDILHIPLVLVHRIQTESINLNKYSAILANLLDGDANVKFDKSNDVISIQWPTISEPLVSLIIPTKNGKELVKACIESILNKTTYPNYEILLIDNNSDEPESLSYFAEINQHPKIRLLEYPHPFNYSSINNFAVSHAKGSIIGLVNNDIEVISENWLSSMVGWVLKDDVGCVGAKLLYADGRVQHAGVVLGYGGGAGHAHKYFPRYHPGYLNRLAATGNFSAVTAACLLVKKDDFDTVGGLDEILQVAFNDVDFCLKVLSLGKRNIYCAEAELFHHESISRGFDDTPEKQARFSRELTYLQTTWANYIQHDPCYNPNLTLSRENFAIREYKV
ncbi:glycosyltransferase family 2 protein [Paraglaciecola sp. 2405UD69-4]|uniref:glycosyltransferase family 2 protein n=1 Tax=Paraglaciecola sp. 2405UD69-4 TaxID=3391836 RepID=UPI0039C9222B